MRNLIIGLLSLFFAASLAAYSQPGSGKRKGASSAQNSLTQEKTESKVENTSTKAIVYVYRFKQFAGSALAPSVYCDEAQLARMDNGRFFKVKLDPGKHTFRANDKQSGIELELKSGEEYYIRVEIVEGFLKGHGRLLLMPKEQGAYEIKKLKALDADKIKDSSKVVTDKS